MTETQFIQRGPIIYFARPRTDSNLADFRLTNPSSFCIVNADETDDYAFRGARFRKLMTPASVAEIDLLNPLPMLANWRYALRKAQAAPIKTTHRPYIPAKDAWLLAADMAQQRQKRFRAMPHAIIQNWPTKDVHMCAATHKGTAIAAMLFLQHGKAATYQVGWANAQGRQFCAHQRLLFEAAQSLAAKGVERLDLGTIDTENSHGLARFKIGAGATIRQLGGTWGALPFWRR